MVQKVTKSRSARATFSDMSVTHASVNDTRRKFGSELGTPAEAKIPGSGFRA